jgi:putative transposase
MFASLLRRYRSSGTVKPKPHGGGQSAKLNSEQVDLITTLVEEDNDAILVELCSRLQERTGVKVSRATMGRMTQKLNLTRKKKLYTPVRDTQNECKS